MRLRALVDMTVERHFVTERVRLLRSPLALGIDIIIGAVPSVIGRRPNILGDGRAIPIPLERDPVAATVSVEGTGGAYPHRGGLVFIGNDAPPSSAGRPHVARNRRAPAVAVMDDDSTGRVGVVRPRRLFPVVTVAPTDGRR